MAKALLVGHDDSRNKTKNPTNYFLVFSPSTAMGALCNHEPHISSIEKKRFFGKTSGDLHNSLLTENNKDNALSHQQHAGPTITFQLLSQGLSDIDKDDVLRYLEYLSPRKGFSSGTNRIMLRKMNNLWVLDTDPLPAMNLMQVTKNYSLAGQGIFIGEISNEMHYILSSATESNEVRMSAPTVVMGLFMNGIKNFNWGKNPKEQLLQLLDPTIPLVK